MKEKVKWTELFALQRTYTYVLRLTRFRWKTAVDIMCIIWNKPKLTVRATVLVSMISKKKNKTKNKISDCIYVSLYKGLWPS